MPPYEPRPRGVSRALARTVTQAVAGRARRMRRSVLARGEALRLEASTTTAGTRRRAIPLAAASLLSLGALLRLVGMGALAVHFTSTGTPTIIATNYLSGSAAGGYLDSQQRVQGPAPTVEVGIKNASLSGLCALADHRFAGIAYTVLLTAGAPVGATSGGDRVTADGAGHPINLIGGDGPSAGDLSPVQAVPNIKASGLLLSATALDAYANHLSGLVVGQNASTVRQSTGIAADAPQFADNAVNGDFGLVAEHLNLSGVDAGSYGIRLQGEMTLPGLRIQMLPGTAASNRARCATQAAP